MEKQMKSRRGANIVTGLFLLAGLVVAAPALHAQVLHRGTDPWGLYGGCSGNLNTSAYSDKARQVYESGNTLANVVGIVVLDCHTFTGGGGVSIVPCPPNSPYSYCLFNDNDGLGNTIYFGVLELNPTTDPNAEYGGCARGSGFRVKSDVVRPVLDPRKFKSIVVTKCQKADGYPGSRIVACPASSIYDTCIENDNDGVGNHVELGVIKIAGEGDPHGLYGGYFSTSGYRTKSVLVTEVGKSLDKVTSIVTTVTNAPVGPGGSQIISCGSELYSYCIHNGDDGVGNSVDVGVIELP